MRRVAEGDPLLVGTALSITGDTSALGIDSQYGAQVAADENAAGGVLGHEIESFTRMPDAATPPPARPPLRRSSPTRASLP